MGKKKAAKSARGGGGARGSGTTTTTGRRGGAAKSATSRTPAAGRGAAPAASPPPPAALPSLTVPITRDLRIRVTNYGAAGAEAPPSGLGGLEVRQPGGWIEIGDAMRRAQERIGAGDLPDLEDAPPFIITAPAEPPVLPQASLIEQALQERLGTRLAAVTNIASAAELQLLPFEISGSMDPRLQVALANRRSGKRMLSISSTAGDEIGVVARVKSVEAWKDLPDVLPGAVLGRSSNEGFLVTGRIHIEDIEDVRASDTVLSLKASQLIQPSLAATIDDLGVASNPMAHGAEPGGGAGVLIGIVDFGCDFAHANFRDAAGRTRLKGIWHQAGVKRAGGPVDYGRFYTEAEINAALGKPDPYAALGYGPQPDTWDEKGSHGAHVMDIAAGSGGGSGQSGVAPKADILFVELASTDIAWEGAQTVRQQFGDSVQLLEAVQFIFEQAGERPCVVNLSLGTNGGPHDGSSLVEQGLDALVNAKANRAVVIAAANAQQHNIHTEGTVLENGHEEIGWNITRKGGGEFELWYPASRRLEVTLISADGTSFGPVAPGENAQWGAPDLAIVISNREADPNNGDNVIGIWVAPGLPGVRWTVRIANAGAGPCEYHAWIERNDRAQAYFANPVPTHTIGSISTGHKSIVVGSYDAHKAAKPISAFSSAGPTRDGRDKPEISAPGHNVDAAYSRTGSGVIRKSGTSMAAPAVTGLVALMLAEARRKGVDLTIDEIRQKLMTTARDAPPAGAPATWDNRYGFGRASPDAV